MLFYIFRHGETEGNVKNLVQGAGLDLPLNENGKDQASVLGQTLAVLKFPVIYSSQMIRAIETAEIVASYVGAEVESVSGLEEVHFGEAEGMLSEEAHAKYGDLFEIINDEGHPQYFDAKLPGGESIRESINRSVKALEKIKSKAEGNRVAVATHGALMHNIYQHYFGLRRRFANCEYFVIDI